MSDTTRMTFLRRVVRHPQSVWLRKALFQVHLWTGIGLGLYVFVLSLTGSAIVFRREITRLAWTPPQVIAAGPLMTVEQLTAAAKKVYPRFESFKVTLSKDPSRAAVVAMTRGQRQRERAFDPYTGKDLSDVGTDEPKLLNWMVRLHDDLLGGHTGRLVNGFGALMLTILCITGAVIWWPGIARWWRSLLVWRRVGWKRFNWDLHSALGFWMFLFVLMWGFSGIYLSYAEPFTALVDWLQPQDPNSLDPRSGDELLASLARVHFGRAYGTSVKWLYVVLGLVPAVMFVTGTIMWWNRVVVPAMRKSDRRRSSADPAVVASNTDLPEMESGLAPPAV
jgi:uncharacterized iron-regulated membrane protein